MELVIVAPESATNAPIGTVVHNYHWRRRELVAAQRFRGKKYSDDGAIARTEELDAYGHVSKDDRQAWHLNLWQHDRLLATLWTLERSEHDRLEDLHCYHPATAASLASARREAQEAGLPFCELGGWAAETPRANLRMLLLGLAIPRALGRHALAACIITERHRANDQIRKMGGASRGVYRDETFNCCMELFVFDSRVATPYDHRLEEMTTQLRAATVLLT